MNLHLHHVRIAVLDEQDDWKIIRGSVYIRNGIIEYVREEVCAVDFKGETEWVHIDCEENLLIPGFVNAHTHSPMTCFRSLADNKPLDQWLNEQIFPREALLSEDDMYWFTKLAILEYLSSGVTSVFDMYFAKDSVARACSEYGFRLTMCGALNDFVQSVPELKELYQKYHNKNDGMLDFKLGFHAQYTTSDERVRELSKLAHELKEPVFTHLSETQKEVNDCVDVYGKTPAEYLAERGIFDYGGGVFHGVYLSKEDISILKEKNVVIVTNPSSNLKLASGIANVERLSKADVIMAIGTDGAASNNALDMFREMYLTSVLSKVVNRDACVVEAREVLKMATINGNRMLGKNDIGIIKEGFRADLVLIDLKQPNMQPENNIIENLIYSGSKINVKFTMVNGRILYQEGKFYLPDNPEKIYGKCNDIVQEKFRKIL